MFGTVLISNKVTWLNQRNLQRIAAFILTFFCHANRLFND